MSKQTEIRELIKSDAVNKVLNSDLQNRHVPGSGAYTEGRTLFPPDLEARIIVQIYTLRLP